MNAFGIVIHAHPHNEGLGCPGCVLLDRLHAAEAVIAEVEIGERAWAWPDKGNIANVRKAIATWREVKGGA